MRRSSLSMWAALILTATPAWAAEEGGGGDVVSRLVNFAIVVAVLVWVFTRVFSLSDFFERRRGSIENDLSASSRELQRAKERLAAIQERVRNQEAEVAELLAAGDADGEAEAQQLLAASREQAARIAKQVEVAAAQAEKRLAQEVRETVVERACGTAEGLIAEAISDDDQQRLVEEVLS